MRCAHLSSLCFTFWIIISSPAKVNSGGFSQSCRCIFLLLLSERPIHAFFFQEVLRARLTHKFKNARRRKSTVLLDEERSSHVRKFGGNTVKGLPGFLPPATTDMIQCCREINSMKGGGDHTAAMRATFAHRRRMIVKEKLPMDQLTEKFPPLFSANGVSNPIVLDHCYRFPTFRLVYNACFISSRLRMKLSKLEI